MKHLTTISAVLASLLARADLHALPEDWEVDLAAQPPQVFTLQRPRGETYELKAVLKRHGKPFEPAITNACIYWQTNGMENLYWSAPASVSNNVLRAYWLPEMDPGATTVRGYIGDPGHIYAAAFQFRFIASPGALPNELPLPQKVIDFAKVRVLNPPWEGGGGGGVNTNAVIDIIHKTVSGAARPLPPYLHALDYDDSYPAEAQAYYDQRQGGGAVPAPQCSAVRSGNFLSRNFDYPFDDRAEFIVKMSAGEVPTSSLGGAYTHRFASVGVANVGTNLTESLVTSGKHSRWYKSLPGATVDGINENGVVAEINVVDGDPQTSGWHPTGDLHPLAAVRWALDNATNAEHAATYLAANIRFPEGWQQNFHYMVADETSTYIVENGEAYPVPSSSLEGAVLTNFRLYPTPSDGEGQERYDLLLSSACCITNAWYTNAYRRETNPPWVSDLAGVLAYTNDIFNAWASHPKEYFRNKTNGGEPWWQSVHTSIYDITNRVLKIAVQETDDWYVFQVPASSLAGAVDEAKVRELAGEVVAPVASSVSSLQSSVSGLESSKRDKTDFFVSEGEWDFGAFRTSAPTAVFRMLEEGPLSPRLEYDESGSGFTTAADGTFGTSPDGRKTFTATSCASRFYGLEGTVLYKSSDVYIAKTTDIPDVPDVIDPSSAATTGKAADALAVKNAIKLNPVFSEWNVRSHGAYELRGFTQPELTELGWVWRVEIRGGPSAEDWTWTDDYEGSSSGSNSTYASGVYTEASRSVDHYTMGSGTEKLLAGTKADLNIPAPYTPPPYLRVYDEVRQCWWRGRMVNGVINWEVE